MRNASWNDNHVAARNGLLDAVWIVLVPETQTRFAIYNAENLMRCCLSHNVDQLDAYSSEVKGTYMKVTCGIHRIPPLWRHNTHGAKVRLNLTRSHSRSECRLVGQEWFVLD